MDQLNWLGLATLIASACCFGLIGFKRSTWWGRAKSIMEALDKDEKRIAKLGGLFFIASLVSFILANL